VNMTAEPTPLEYIDDGDVELVERAIPITQPDSDLDLSDLKIAFAPRKGGTLPPRIAGYDILKSPEHSELADLGDMKYIKKRGDGDEESNNLKLAGGGLTSIDVGKSPKTHLGKQTSVQESLAGDTRIQITPQHGIESGTLTLGNPFASPSVKSGQTFAEAVRDSLVSLSFASPVRTLTPMCVQKLSKIRGVTTGVKALESPWTAAQNTPEYISTSPTCALNLICYRTGTKGCELHQVQAVLESRFKDKEAFQNKILRNPNLISTDVQFFQALRSVYLQKMCGFWRRAFFLKTLRGIRLLSVSYSIMTPIPII